MRFCKVDGCEREHYAKGWCHRHWQRAHRAFPRESRHAQVANVNRLPMLRHP